MKTEFEARPVFVRQEDNGYIPCHKRTKLTDALLTAFGFRKDYEFLPKADMRVIIKETKQKK